MFLALILFFVGISLQFLLNGQPFNNGIMGIFLLSSAAAVSIWHDRNTVPSPFRRLTYRVFAGLTFFVIVILLIKLPSDHATQSQLNRNVEKLRQEQEELAQRVQDILNP